MLVDVQPTMNYGNPCVETREPWIGRCNYDAAFEILDHIYGNLKVRCHLNLCILPELNPTSRVTWKHLGRHISWMAWSIPVTFEYIINCDAKMTFSRYGHKIQVKVRPRSRVKIRYCNNSDTGRRILNKSCTIMPLFQHESIIESKPIFSSSATVWTRSECFLVSF